MKTNLRTAVARAACAASLVSLLGACAEPRGISEPATTEQAVHAQNVSRALSGSYTIGGITLETRYWDGTSTLPTTATAASVFNALPTDSAGYTNQPYQLPSLAGTIAEIVSDVSGTDTSYAGIRNPAGSHYNLATRYRVTINATTASVLFVQFGVDARGAAMYVDGTPATENWNDPWWGGWFMSDTASYDGCVDLGPPNCLAKWAPNPDALNATITLTPGAHTLEVLAFEDGSDGGAAARIDAGQGFQFMVSSVQPAQTLTVTRPGTGSGRVTSSPAGINCTNACSAAFPLGSTVTLTATASAGSVFSGWTGACSGLGACTVTMYQALTVGATFATLPTISAMTMETRFWDGTGFTKTGAGATAFFSSLPTNVAGYTNEPVPVSSFVKNASLFAAPNVGANLKLGSRYVVQMTAGKAVNISFRFSADMGGGGVMLIDGTEFASYWGNANGPMFEMPTTLAAGTHTIQVVGFEDCCDGFAALLEYNVGAGWMTATAPPPPATPLTVSIPSGGGSVTSSPTGINCGPTCQANFAAGSQVNLTASPAPYFAFGSWGGACSGTSPTCSVRVLQPSRSVTASFTRLAWPLTVTTSGTGGGTVTADPVGTACGTNCWSYAPGATVTFTATPDANSTFAGWNVAGCTAASCTVTVNSALTVTAQFAKKQVTLSVTKSGTGSGTVTSAPSGINCGATCSASFALGTVVTLTAAPTAGSQFAGWGGACSGMGTCSVTLAAAASVTAQFTKLADTTPPELSCSASPDVLWPPNHKMADIRVKVTFKDAGSGIGTFALLSVTSDEPDDAPEKGKLSLRWTRDDDSRSKTERHKKHVGGGRHWDGDDCGYDDDDDDDEHGDGSTVNDIQGWAIGTADVMGQLRAERLGSGNGRVYTLTYRGTDQAGNIATATCTVTVPKSQGRGR